MSSSAYNLSVPANRVRSEYPRGWVETDTTRRILDDIDQPHHRKKFRDKVASQSVLGLTPRQIDDHWNTCPKSEIPGYDEQRPEEWSETESKADPSNRSQRSVDSRQAGPSRPLGANEGTWRDGYEYYTEQRGLDSISAESPRREDGDYYIGQRGYDSIYAESPRRENGDYYASGRALNSIYAPRPRSEDRDYNASRRALNSIYAPRPRREDGDYNASRRASNCIYAPRGPASSSLPWSVADPLSSASNHHQHDPSFDSVYDRSRSYEPSWDGYPRYDYTSYEAGVTPSGNRSGGNLTPYGSDDEYSSGLDYSGSTLVNSHSGSPQGRASRGSEQGRRDSGRAYR